MARRPTIKIKNFEEYQHYKHRNPPWIKLHLSLLDDPDFLRLPDASKWHYIGLLLLASRHGNDILNDPLYIANRLGITEKLDLTKRFLKEHVLASNASVLPTNADSEKSRDRVETETEKSPPLSPQGEVCVVDAFEQFWSAYPRKVGKEAARRVWGKIKNRPPVIYLTEAIQRSKETEQWKKDNGQFIPHPATWLNQGRWDDEPVEVNGMSDPHGTLAGMKAFLERGT